MITPLGLLIILIGVTVTLIVLVLAYPAITATRGGKVLVFVAFFILPVLAATMGSAEHMERSKSTQFCLSCHVMEDYGKSLYIDDPTYLPAGHFQNGRVPRDHACYTCHTDYVLYGTIKAKMRGLRHVYVNYFGRPAQPIRLYSAYNNRECLHCHQGARSFEEGTLHNADAETMLAIKANRMSCMTSGCHENVHAVGQLKELKFWKPTS
ncbi:MAG: NapC/NirT family cytochrome c [Acidobacteriales bacterium]|nr:NapC/NirT family cytochrome c [Terriglobales bacterium]